MASGASIKVLTLPVSDGSPMWILNEKSHNYLTILEIVGRQLIYGSARIGLHRSFSNTLVSMNDGKPISFVQKALSGMASGSIAVCIGTPFDIALVRLQADGMADPKDRRNYKNVFDVSDLKWRFFG